MKISKVTLNRIIKEELQRVITEQQSESSIKIWLEDLLEGMLPPEEDRELFFNEVGTRMNKDCPGLLGSDSTWDKMKLTYCAAKHMTDVAQEIAWVEGIDWIANKLGDLVLGGMPHE
jgi:hypothetical protein